jgi:hypothetical protein
MSFNTRLQAPFFREAEMQLSMTTSFQQTQLDYSQLTVNQPVNSAVPTQLLEPKSDRIELSNESRRSHDDDHSVGHVRKTHHDRNNNPLFDLLKNILEQITGAQVNDLKKAPVAAAPSIPIPQGSPAAYSAQQANLSLETSSLTVGGSISTSDGAKISFNLDLTMMHASASAVVINANNGSGGYNFNFAGSSAELTTTRFSFSLSAELPDGTPTSGSGLGTFSLKDDLKEVRQVMKPLIKEFLKSANMPSDKNSVNQLLRTIV